MTTPTPDFDLLVIGAGSGGVAASRRAALHGARVAIAEGRRVGGTCVLRGCVPKKLLMYAAEAADGLEAARAFGWDIADARFDMVRWAAGKAAETTRLEQVYRHMLADAHVELIEGRAQLEGHGRARIGDRVVTAREVIIATGSSPVSDSITGIAQAPTSDDLLDLRQLPVQATVVGGGYIAVEFASMLARFGVPVDLRYRDRLPLRGFDPMLRTAAAEELAAAGVALHPGGAPTSVQRDPDGWMLTLAGGRSMHTPWLLNATGRRPNTAGLGLETVGIAVDASHAIPVDAHGHTAAPGVHAIGDVTNRVNLTPVAIAEGRALADTLFGAGGRAVDLSRVASAVFMLPPIGSVGPTEDALVASGRPIRVYEAAFRPMKQAFAGGTQRTRMKLLVDDASDQVLAVHMIGTDAPEIVQSLAVALTAGATKTDFDRTLAVHPTAADEFVLMREPTRRLPAAAVS